MPQSQYYSQGIKIPENIAHQISLRAAQLARQYAPRGPKNSRSKIRATSAAGKVGIYIPPDAEHLLYLDRGIRPFIMYSLEGKVIPIRNPDGSINFRKAKNIGGNRIASRDEKGRITSSNRRWKHPGTEPLNFIDKALNEAVKEWIDSLTSEDVLDLLQEYPEFKNLNQFINFPLKSKVNFK